jgi:hypothetical protein
MAKENSMDKLNAVYNSILGGGEPLTAEDDARSAGLGDEAYLQEDYSDDEGSGQDPRDESTLKNEDETELDDETVDAQDAEKEAGTDDSEEEELIPDHLVAAGRAARLDDKTIIELAETRPEILEALAAAQESARRAVIPQTQDKAKDTEKKEDALDPIPDDLGMDDEDYDDLSPKVKNTLKQLADRVNKLTETVTQQSQGIGQIQQKAQQEAIRKVDEFFDKQTKELPQLGVSAKLTQEQADARLYAFRIARGAQQAFGGTLSDEDALMIGVNALKGQMKDSQLKAKLVSDLNKNKKRFTSRYRGRAGNETKLTAEERAMSEINRILDDPNYKSH